MEGFKTLYCSSKFPRARGSNSSKFIVNLSMRTQKVRQPSHRLRALNRAARERERERGANRRLEKTAYWGVL
jgi:hypothetical protein